MKTTLTLVPGSVSLAQWRRVWQGDVAIAPVGDGHALNAVLAQEIFRDGADGLGIGGGRRGQAGGPGGGQGGEGGDLAHMTNEVTAVHAAGISS